MRVAKACKECRTSKRKCLLDKAGEACTQCSRSRLTCSFISQHRRPQSTLLSVNAILGKSDSEYNLPFFNSVAEQLVDHYIKLVHDRPHSIFHLPTLRTDLKNKRLNPGLLYAVLSFGCRFHDDAKISSLGMSFFEESKRCLHLDLENVCLENIQTCILLANLSAASLKPSSEALYLAIAIRMAEILRFDVTNSKDSFVVKETKRRIWWTLFMFDTWCSAGNSVPRKMKGFDMTVDLPMDEFIFHRLEVDQYTYSEPCQPGLWAYMITLVRIFGRILDFNKRVVQETSNEDSLDIEVQSLAQSLDAWEDSLPQHIKMNPTNLHFHRQKGHGGAFVALHMGFYHYSTVLFYQYLDINRPTTPNSQAFAERCKHHASSLSGLLKMAREIENCEVLYPGVGHSTVVSSSVLLHTLLFGRETEIENAKACLQSNFVILKDLRRYWPSVELTVKRLTVFQSLCLQAAASQTYKFDKWLVRFLLEYHLPLEEKYSGKEVPYATKKMTSLSTAQSAILAQRASIGEKALSGWF